MPGRPARRWPAHVDWSCLCPLSGKFANSWSDSPRHPRSFPAARQPRRLRRRPLGVPGRGHHVLMVGVGRSFCTKSASSPRSPARPCAVSALPYPAARTLRVPGPRRRATSTKGSVRSTNSPSGSAALPRRERFMACGQGSTTAKGSSTWPSPTIPGRSVWEASFHGPAWPAASATACWATRRRPWKISTKPSGGGRAGRMRSSRGLGRTMPWGRWTGPWTTPAWPSNSSRMDRSACWQGPGCWPPAACSIRRWRTWNARCRSVHPSPRPSSSAAASIAIAPVLRNRPRPISKRRWRTSPLWCA